MKKIFAFVFAFLALIVILNLFRFNTTFVIKTMLAALACFLIFGTIVYVVRNWLSEKEKANIDKSEFTEMLMIKKQLQGICLILFAIVLILFAMLDPWIPVIGELLPPALLAFGGLVTGITGLVLALKKEN